MFKVIYSHRFSKDLTFTKETYNNFLASGDIRYPENWDTLLIIFGLIKIKL